jgi:Carbohydrate esterase, sialic acid-specific acetylesterase
MKSMRGLFPLVLAILCFREAARGQVTFQDAPVKNRLYARDPAKDSGDVAFQGTVNKTGANYQEIRIKAYRNGTALPTATQKLTFSGNNASFTMAYRIMAELANYKFEIAGFDGTAETIVRSADSIVAGDVFIVQGQSNAEAHSFDNTSAKANVSPYIRVYGSSNPDTYYTDWKVGQGDDGMNSVANTGQWELRMARQIVENQKIPVAIFNGNHSGQPISFFQRTDANPENTANNYGRLLRRLKATGMTNKVRAIFWVQGENNSTMSTANYKTAFATLRQDWLADYPSTERIYLFQLRNGCISSEAGMTVAGMANILEAERQLALELPNIENMSMSAQTHDAGTVCHYPFPKGYELMGNNIYRLVARDFYGVDGDNIEPPAIKFAEASGAQEITLIMKNILDTLTWNAGSQSEFEVTGGSAKVTAGSAAGNKVKLTLSGSASNVTAITFLGHSEVPPEPLVLNLNGVGALHFKGFPITMPDQRDSASVAAILKANGLNVSVSSVVTRNAAGRVTALNLHGKQLTVLPGDVAFLDSLTTLDVGANKLTALPREVTKLPAAIIADLNGNALCQAPDAVAAWAGSHALDPAWKNTQTTCGVTAIATSPGRIAPALAKYRVSGRNLVITFLRPGDASEMGIVNAAGALVYRGRSTGKEISINASGWASGIHILRLQTSEGRQVVRLPWLP